MNHTTPHLLCRGFLAALFMTSATALAEPAATSEIDNGYTSKKTLSLPAPMLEQARVVDQSVFNSGYGGLDAGWPDVFRFLDAGQQSVVIEVVTLDAKAIDYGVVVSSSPISLDGVPVAATATHANGLGFAQSLPGLWVGFQGKDSSGVVLINPSDFTVARHYPTANATVRDLLVIDSPLRADDAPASDESHPQLFVAVDRDGNNQIDVFDAVTGKLIRTFDAPPGRITAIAAAPIAEKSRAVGIDQAYPWLLVATVQDDKPALTFINTRDGQQNGGPIAAPTGIVTNLCFADTPFSKVNPDRPDIFVGYANGRGENAVRVYDSLSNNSIGSEYTDRQPRGELVGLTVMKTNHPQGTGDPGYGALIYAVNKR